MVATPTPTAVSFLGFGKESTPGTAVTATAFMPVKTFAPHDLYHYVPDQNLRGSMVMTYDEVATQRWAEYGFGGDLFVDVVGHSFLNLMGADVVTGTAAPFTHTFSLLNTAPFQPVTHTLVDYNGFNSRQWPFMRINEFTFKFDGTQLLTYDMKAVGFASSTVAKPTQSFSGQRVKPSYEGAISIAGGSTGQLVAGEVTVKRSVDPIIAVTGSQDPYYNWAGPLESSGKFTAIYTDDTLVGDYTAGTIVALDMNFSDTTQGATPGQANAFKYHATKGLFIDAQINRGKTWVELDVTFESVANTTDVGASGGYSPCQLFLTNPTASY